MHSNLASLLRIRFSIQPKTNNKTTTSGRVAVAIAAAAATQNRVKA